MFTTAFFLFLLLIVVFFGFIFGMIVEFFPFILLALAIILIVKWVNSRTDQSEKTIMQEELSTLRLEMAQMQSGKAKNKDEIPETEAPEEEENPDNAKTAIPDDAPLQPVVKSATAAAPEIIMDYTPPPPSEKSTISQENDSFDDDISAQKGKDSPPETTDKTTPIETPSALIGEDFDAYPKASPTPPPSLPYEDYKLSSFELPDDFEWDRWACWKALIAYTFSKKGLKDVAESSLEAILGGKFFSWLGRIALTLGAIFFLGYLFTVIEIQPKVFIPITGLCGAAILGLGFFIQKKWPKIAAFLGCSGITVLYASIFAAASDRFDLVPDQIGFIFAFGISLIALYPAARLSKYMPLLGAIGAYVTPFIGNVGNLNFMLAYLSALTTIFIIYGLRRKLIEPLIGCGLGSIGWVYYLLVNTQFLPDYNVLEGNLLALYFIATILGLLYAAHKLVETTKLKEREDLAAWPVWALALLSMGIIALSAQYYDHNFIFCLAPPLFALGFGFFAKAHPRIQHVFTFWCLFFLALPFWQVNFMSANLPYFALKIGLIYLPMLCYTAWHSDSENNVWPHGLTAAGIALLAYYANYFSMTDTLVISNGTWTAINHLPLQSPDFLIAYSDTFWAITGLALTFLFGLMTYWAYSRAKEIDLTVSAATDTSISKNTVETRMNAISLANIFGITAILIGLNALYLAADINGLTLIFAIIAFIFAGTDAFLSKTRNHDTDWARYGAVIMAIFTCLAFFVTDPYSIMPNRINGFSWATVFLGLPALLFSLSATLLSSRKIDKNVHFLDFFASIFALFWITQDVTLIKEAANWTRHIGTLTQFGWIITGSLAFAALQLHTAKSGNYKRIILSYSAYAITALGFFGLAEIIFYILDNNIYRTIGNGIILNNLIPALLLPAILFTFIGWKLRQATLHFYGYALYITAYAASLCYITFEAMYINNLNIIGQNILDFGYTLVSLSWIIYALILMTLALTLKNRAFRLASLATMLMACAKVFIIDLSMLEGLARAASFLGLGASLMLIGWLYQNVITIDKEEEGEESKEEKTAPETLEEPEKTEKS